MRIGLLSLIILTILSTCNGGRSFYYANKDFDLMENEVMDPKRYDDLDIKKLYRKGDVSGMIFLGDGFKSYDEARRSLIDKAKNANLYKTRCSVMLSYFLPLYPWDLWFYPKEARVKTLNKALTNAKKKGVKGDSLKDIIFKEVWFGGPIFSYTCITAVANLTNSKN